MSANFLLISALLLLSSVSGQEVKKEQLDDVAKLRAELTEQLSPTLKVTPAKQAEVDAIRNEILNAVSSKKYKYDSPSGKGAKDGDKMLGSPLWNRIKYSQKNLIELVGTNSPAKENETKPDIPDSMKFLGKFNLNSNSYRDVIDLVAINENLLFEFEKPVKMWRTISNSLSGNRHLLLGITANSLVMAKLIDGHFQLMDEMPFADHELNHNGFEAFLYWNNNAGQSEGYAVLAVNNELLWIRLGAVGDDFNKLEVVWRWTIHKPVVHIKYFKHKNISMILMAAETPSLDVYGFNLENREFSQIQSIRLQVPCKSIAVVEWKKQFVLVVPLTNTTQVYKYTDFKFTLTETVESVGVTQVAGFQAGGLCFFAIGGKAPKIMRYRNNGLNEISIVGELRQFVRQWIPIPIHTFRDDVLLLAQYEVKLGMHALTTIGTLRWNGDAFEMFYNVPCYMDDVLHSNGINCLIDSDEELGLAGAVVLAKSYNVSMLVPRKEAKSGLFDFTIEIRAAPHPKEEKLIDIQMMFDFFAQQKEYNKMVLENAQETIQNAVRLNGEDAAAINVTGSWTIDKVEAENVIFNGATALNKSSELQERSESVKNSTNEDALSMLNNLAQDILEITKKVENWEMGKKAARFPLNGQLRIDSLRVEKSEEEGAKIVHSGNEQLRNMRILDAQGRSLAKRELQLEKLQVDNIEFDQVNGIPKEDLVFRLELDNLHLRNTLEVDSLTVLDDLQGSVNGMDLNHDLIHSQSTFKDGKISFQDLNVDSVSTKNGINGKLLEKVAKADQPRNTIKTDSIIVENDLSADYINGVKWTSFADQIVRRDSRTRIGRLVTGGNVVLGSDAVIANINNISFPDGFYWRTEKDFVKFTGRKTFKSPVVTDDIDMDESGLIDKVPQNRLISLSAGRAYFPNKTIFADNLELIHGFLIKNTSNIEGPHMDKFLANPTLKEDRYVKAACSFRYLRVEGKVILKGLINNIDLKSSLADLVYITEKPIRVNGFKEFNSANIPYVVTELLNGHDLDSFVTLDTEQTLLASQLIANSTHFNYVRLNGLFDFVNLTEFYENSVKTSGDQVTEAHLIFQIPDDQPTINSYDLLAKNIYIRDTLNTFKPDLFLDDSNIFAFAGKLEAAEVFVDRLYLDGQLKSGGGQIINGHDMRQYNLNRFSKTKVQTIQSPMIIQNLINSDFNFNRMNSVGQADLHLALSTLSAFEHDFDRHLFNILHITESANFEWINGENMKSLMTNVVWLNQSNELVQDFTCLDNVWVENKIVLGGSFNGEREFFSRVVWKDQNSSTIQLKGRFKFHKDVIVEGDINAPSINAIAIDDLLTKTNPKFHGNILLKKNLNVHSQLKTNDWMITPTFSANSLGQIYSYDFSKATHEIHLKKVVFNKPSRIPHLHIGGALNGIANIQEFIGGIIQFDSPKIFLKVPKTNLKGFHFHNLEIDFLNDHNMQQFLDHAILHSEGSPVKEISGKIQFSNIIEAPTISVTDMVSVDKINGMELQDWIKDTVYSTQNLVWEEPAEISASTFKMNSIFAKSLNGIPMDRLDLISVDRHLAGLSQIDNLYTNYPVEVDGFVNGFKLQAEEQNSFMSYGKIQKLSRATFHEIRVMKNLTIDGFVNGNHIERTIKVDGQPITIESPIAFAHLQCQHLYTDHKISGIDFDSWLNETLKYNSGGVQNVTKTWYVGALNVNESIVGEDQINGQNLKGFLTTYNANRRYLHSYEAEMQFVYWKMCSQVKDYFASPQFPGCSFKHFEFKLEVETPELSAVKSMLIFQHLEDDFMIYSSGCFSRLLRWNSKLSNFQEIDLIASGSVRKWIYVKSASKGLFLVAQNDGYCPNVLVNGIWTWNNQQKLIPLKQLSAGRIGDIEKSPFKRDSFYAIDGATVKEFQLPSCAVVSQWILEIKSESLRFIPNRHDSHKLFVTDGTEVHVITIRPSSRHKRHWSLFNVRSKRFEEKMKILNEFLGMNKSEFLKNLKEALLMRKINAASKLIKPVSDVKDEVILKEEGAIIEGQNSSDPKVGGQLFDDIQKALKKGSELLVDTSMGVLDNVDDEKVDSLLDHIEDAFVAGPQNETEPIVQGALFDIIQDGLKQGSQTLVDTSMDVLENIDDEKVDNLLDQIEDWLLTSPQNDTADPMVQGTLVDVAASVLEEATQTLVDGSAEILEQISELVDLDEILQNPQYPQSAQEVHEMHIKNGLTNDSFVGNPKEIVRFPNVFPQASEIISIRVGSGSQTRTLLAAKTNNGIVIYEGLSTQPPFQSLTCSNPSSLLSLNLDQETLFIFLENYISIQIYIFRGMMGFVKYLQIDMVHPVHYLTTTALPTHPDGCLANFLTTVYNNRITFLEAETVGHCMNEAIDCDNY